MSTLFTLNQSWQTAPWLYEKLAYAMPGDTLLLMEEAVLSLQSPVSLGSFLAKCQAQRISVLALKPDVMIRGVDNQYPDISEIDFSNFVDLVASHNKQVAW